MELIIKKVGGGEGTWVAEFNGATLDHCATLKGLLRDVARFAEDIEEEVKAQD